MSKDGLRVLGVGGGPPPGYLWNVEVLDVAYREAMRELDDAQYEYLADQVRELARQPDPTHADHLSIDAVDDFHELREKGGVLGRKNMRVFFSVHPDPWRVLVILGVKKKEADGQTPVHFKVTMSRRRRLWLDDQMRLIRGE